MTHRSLVKFVATCVILGIIGLGLGGCGRRGPLEAPPDPLVEAKKDSSGKPKRPKRTPIKKPDSFVLDPLV